jgi:hypothetical protein
MKQRAAVAIVSPKQINVGQQLRCLNLDRREIGVALFWSNMLHGLSVARVGSEHPETILGCFETSVAIVRPVSAAGWTVHRFTSDASSVILEARAVNHEDRA